MLIFCKIRKFIYIFIAVLIIGELTIRAAGHLYFLYYRLSTLITRSPLDFDKETFRIICVGESTTAGAPVQGNGYPEQLERILKREFTDRKFKVFNLGVCAITSSEIARHFHKNIIYYRPHLVIILIGHNCNGITMFRIPKKDGILNNAAYFTVNRIINNLKIARLLKFAFDIYKLHKDNRLDIQKIYPDVYLTYKIPFRMNFEEHRENLEYVVKIANKYDCRVLLCNYFFLREINTFLRNFAIQRNIPFCDNENIYKEYKKKYGSITGLISEDDFHPNAKGYSIMAQNLYESIIKYNLVN